VIVEQALAVVGYVAGALLDGLPAYTVPAWVTGSASFFGTVFGYASSMGAWFNAPLLLTVLLAVLAVNLFGFGVKLTRSVISLFTGGGGSAS